MTEALAGQEYRPGRRRGVAALLAVVGALTGLFLFYGSGPVIVHDPDRALDHVVLTGGLRTHEFTRLPRGYHLGFASRGGFEGLGEEPLLICRNGSVVSLGYVMNFDMSWRTISAADCQGGTREKPRYIDAEG